MLPNYHPATHRPTRSLPRRRLPRCSVVRKALLWAAPPSVGRSLLGAFRPHRRRPPALVAASVWKARSSFVKPPSSTQFWPKLHPSFKLPSANVTQDVYKYSSSVPPSTTHSLLCLYICSRTPRHYQILILSLIQSLVADIANAHSPSNPRISHTHTLSSPFPDFFCLHIPTSTNPALHVSLGRSPSCRGSVRCAVYRPAPLLVVPCCTICSSASSVKLSPRSPSFPLIIATLPFRSELAPSVNATLRDHILLLLLLITSLPLFPLSLSIHTPIDIYFLLLSVHHAIREHAPVPESFVLVHTCFPLCFDCCARASWDCSCSMFLFSPRYSVVYM